MHICHELYCLQHTLFSFAIDTILWRILVYVYIHTSWYMCTYTLISRTIYQWCGESWFGRGCFATGICVHTHVFHELYHLMCHKIYHSPFIAFCGESTFDVGTIGVVEITHIFHELYHINVTNCIVYIFPTNDTRDMDCVDAKGPRVHSK